MDQTVEEFFHDFRQDMMAGAEVNNAFQRAEFSESIANELVETGVVDGFEFCHYRAEKGMAVDGYWFNDEGGLDLFIADFDSRTEPVSLIRTEVDVIFKRLRNFFEASRDSGLSNKLEETSPEFGLARELEDRKKLVHRVNFYLLSERVLSERMKALEGDSVSGIPATYHVWDISRLQRLRSSRGQKEALEIDFREVMGKGLPCLPAHLGEGTFQSYLVVMPGEVLANLYEKYGSRLLEQNVRSFLQARGNVNKGIRATIMNEPDMFFSYNNGITATAQQVETDASGNGLEITRITDLQVVNGGQTTASLFHTRRKDKAELKAIFVQMKLSVIPGDESETVVPRISEYANTQNRVNAADFFSNHPFHIRIEEFSRRMWAPAQDGAQRETKWFYERARGAFADAQSKLSLAQQKKFKAEYPKPQMFTKTDLAKFENVWDEHPMWVNRGAQKNFGEYAKRIGKLWGKDPDAINEYYFRRIVARSIIFRKTEKMVSDQPWYNGGYRANIVAYTIASINEICRRANKSIDVKRIWNIQAVPPGLMDALIIISEPIAENIAAPPSGISNVTEWCKKDGCWMQVQKLLPELEKELPDTFWSELVLADDQRHEAKSAKLTQKIDDGIDAQKWVFEVPVDHWVRIATEPPKKLSLTPKEVGILKIATQIPVKIPSEKQSSILIDIYRRATDEGIIKPSD